MKASSIEWEIEITLSNEELIRLKESPLIATIKRYSQRGNHDEIPLKIERGKTSEQNLFIDLHTMPPKVYWEDAREYQLVISDFAYQRLEIDKTVGERLYSNPALKILIKIK